MQQELKQKKKTHCRVGRKWVKITTEQEVYVSENVLFTRFMMNHCKRLFCVHFSMLTSCLFSIIVTKIETLVDELHEVLNEKKLRFILS